MHQIKLYIKFASFRYKLYLSDELHGLFRNIGDGVGMGQDHCEFLGSKQSATAHGSFMECAGNCNGMCMHVITY